MYRMKASVAHSVVDCVTAEPERSELPAGDDTVLPGGEPGDRHVDATRPTLTVTVAVNVGRVAHGPIVTRNPCRRSTGLSRISSDRREDRQSVERYQQQRLRSTLRRATLRP
jgi:hypothetical protein